MFEDYCDYYDGSELDLAYQEFLDKVHTFAKDGIKKQIEDISKTRENLEKECKDLIRRRMELDDRERELEKRERTFEDKKLSVISNWVQEKGCDLKADQHCWVIRSKYEKQECPTCHDKRKLKLYSQAEDKEFEVTCPTCNGYNYTKRTYYIQECVIKQINLSFYCKKDHIGESSTEWETIGIWVDFVGTRENSQQYNRKNIYLTKEEAEKALLDKKEK